MNYVNQKNFWTAIIIIALSLFVLFLYETVVPFHMDEIGHHHALANTYYPFNQYNVFRESAGSYDLALFGSHFFPLRSSDYIGSLQSLLYYPLFRLWPSHHSARLLGLLMLIGQAFLIHKIFKVSPLLSFVLLVAFMPYAFQHIVDFGTISFQTTSIFLICYLSKKWSDALRYDRYSGWTYPFLIGVIIFLGIWTKMIFFAVIPGIFFLIVYSLFEEKNIPVKPFNRRKLFCQSLLLFASFGILFFLLLNSTDRYQYKYYQVLNSYARLLHPMPKTNLMQYLFNPLLTADRIFIIKTHQGSILGIVFIATICLMVIWGIRLLHQKKINYHFAILNIFLFFLTFFNISLHPRSWCMQHVVLAFPFLILAISHIYAKTAKNKILFSFLGLFIALNISLYAYLPRLKYKQDAHPSIVKLNTFLNKNYADDYVFIVFDWGIYYTKALYGKKHQCVLYIDPEYNETWQINKIKRIFSVLNRKALFVGTDYALPFFLRIHKNFDNLIEMQIDFDTGGWRVWYQK